jgi:DNA-binding SARP family transcriptional activator
MEFKLLGPFCIDFDTGEVPSDSALRSLGQRNIRETIIAMLVNAGRPLSPSRLRDLLWGENRPEYENRVSTRMAEARKILGAHRLGAKTEAGYMLALADNDGLDLQRFHRLIKEGRRAREKGYVQEAVGLFHEGLEEWREPLTDDWSTDFPRTPVADGIVYQLLGERRDVRMELADLLADQGRYFDLITALRGWLRTDLHEPFWARLILALQRVGRSAEAIKTFDDARRDLSTTLGVEPNPLLQLMTQRIREELDPAENMPYPWVPAHAPGINILAPAKDKQPSAKIPSELRDFTGRVAACDHVMRHIRTATGARTAPVAWITGPPGVGKTSVAVHVAHSLARTQTYSNGLIYVRLANSSSSAKDVGTVFHQVLRELGAPARIIPTNFSQRKAMYQQWLAVRRVLLVFDHAADDEQVRDLIPAGPSAVLITSRHCTPALPNCRVIALGPLGHNDARALLSAIIGSRRVEAEPEAADRLMTICAGLPLAVRAVGARLALAPDRPLRYFVEAVEEHPRRLDYLSAGDVTVRQAIATSYRNLDSRCRRAFRRLALLDSEHFPPWVLAPLLGDPRVDQVLQTLANRSLITTATPGAAGEPRFEMHPLFRDFASERLRDDGDAEAALARLLAVKSNVLVGRRRR